MSVTTTKKITPLPTKVVTVTTIVQFAEAFQVSVLFPFVPFMVADFPTIPEDQVGTYSGLLAASFVFGQLLSSYPWGLLSDRYGEKLIISISLFFTFVFSTLFGFSRDFGTAYVARFCAGLFNGNIGVIKTYLGKNSDSTNQGKAMALMSAAWVIGTIVAPTIGGFLAQPARQYPQLFSQDGFFGTFPYCLPAFCSSLVLLISWVATMICMDDEVFTRTVQSFSARMQSSFLVNVFFSLGFKVNPTKRAFRKPGLKQKRSDVFYDVVAHSPANSDHEMEMSDRESHHPNHSENETVEIVSREEEQPEEQPKDATNATPSPSPSPSPSPFPTTSTKAPANLSRAEFLQMLFSATMYSAVGFLFIALDETFPLFCRASLEDGGLNFQTNQIGLALSVMGIIEILYIVIIFPWVTRTFSEMVLLRFSLGLFVPIIISYPLANLLAVTAPTWCLWLVLLSNLGLRGISSTNIYTPVMMFINNSVPKDYMGRANGVGQTFAAAMRTVGPPLSGLLWSVTTQANFPLHNMVIFFILASFSLFLVFLSYFYPKSIEKSYEERKSLGQTTM